MGTLTDRELLERQESLVRQWRQSDMVAVRRIPIEDQILIGNCRHSADDPSGLLEERIAHIERYITDTILNPRHLRYGRTPDQEVFGLLANFCHLLPDPKYEPKIVSFIEHITRPYTADFPGGRRDQLLKEEVETFLAAIFSSAQPGKDPSHCSTTLLKAIIIVGSRGILPSDSIALRQYPKEDIFTPGQLYEGVEMLKERADHPLTTKEGYKLTIEALGYAIINHLTRYPENWESIIPRLRDQPGPSLPYLIKQALSKDGDYQNVSATDLAGDLAQHLKHLATFAGKARGCHEDSPLDQDRFCRIANILCGTLGALNSIQADT